MSDDLLDDIMRKISDGQLEAGLRQLADLMAGLRDDIAADDVAVVAIQRGQLKDIQRSAAAGSVSPEEKQRQLASLSARVLSHISGLEEAIRRAGMPKELKMDEPAVAPPVEIYEALVNDCLTDIAWLKKGLATAKAVCKVKLPGTAGTGFLIKGGYLVTNNHVLRDESAVREAVAIFNFEEDGPGNLRPTTTYRLLTDTFSTDPSLDCSMVKLDDSTSEIPLSHWGEIALAIGSAPVVADPVSIIQHPLGAPKRIGLLKSVVAKTAGHHLYYTTDTQKGSSGSPVLDIRWRAVALHHAAGETEKGKTVNNKGILFSEIARHQNFKPIVQ